MQPEFCLTVSSIHGNKYKISCKKERELFGYIIKVLYMNLHPSAWEYQSAALGYNYHTARQVGAATVRYISYHPVITNLSPCCGANQSLS